MKYRIKCTETWLVHETLEIDATSLDEALQLAKETMQDSPVNWDNAVLVDREETILMY